MWNIWRYVWNKLLSKNDTVRNGSKWATNHNNNPDLVVGGKTKIVLEVNKNRKKKIKRSFHFEYAVCDAERVTFIDFDFYFVLSQMEYKSVANRSSKCQSQINETLFALIRFILERLHQSITWKHFFCLPSKKWETRLIYKINKLWTFQLFALHVAWY